MQIKNTIPQTKIKIKIKTVFIKICPKIYTRGVGERINPQSFKYTH